MRSTLGLSLVLLCAAGASAQDIRTTKYGLAHPDDMDYRHIFTPPTAPNRTYVASDFAGSYQYSTGRFDSLSAGPDCGAGSTAFTAVDREYTPILGQVLLTEDQSCVPTSTGPGCTAGDPGKIGAACHLPLGTASATDDGGSDLTDLQVRAECGAGGTCAIAAGTSCPVEIPKTTPTTPTGDRSDFITYFWIKNAFQGMEFVSSSPYSFGGTAAPPCPDDPDPLKDRVRAEKSQGQRYLLPAVRGGNGTKTFIRWNEDARTGLFRVGDFGKSCCNSSGNTLCGAIFGYPEYDQTGLLGVNDCFAASSLHVWVQSPDWIFGGGPGSDFQTDPDFVVPGQKVGVCRANRAKSCTTLSPVPPNFGPQTDCSTLDADPATPGLQPDTCDFREDGFRATRPPNLPSGYPNTSQCGISLYVLKGTAQQNCVLLDHYEEDGDPGLHCEVANIGGRHLWDGNCDGSPDGPDLCPLLNEFDQLKDTDEDCGTPGSPGYPLPGCRGDECECGDHTLDGQVNVLDMVSMNLAIFGAVIPQPTCDTNLDYVCNVSDIVGANLEIYNPGSSICSHITTANCGNGDPDPGEECDDGNRISGDGCSAVCRDET